MTTAPIPPHEQAHEAGVLPCPLCDWHAVPANGGGGYHYVHCASETCLARGPVRGGPLEAIAAWNTRACQPDPRVAAFDGEGWVYFSPDAGTEYAQQHPIESGETPDATDIRRSTAIEDALHARVNALASFPEGGPARCPHGILSPWQCHECDEENPMPEGWKP